MNTDRVLLIFNPKAGRSMIGGHLVGILQILTSAGLKVECYPTSGPGDARDLVRGLSEGYRMILCAGGDGTLDEVVCGMMENEKLFGVPAGYIPAGTTNDFASTLQIPTDMEEAAAVITGGRAMDCDIGCFNGNAYFTYIAAFGLFTDTSYETPQELKNVFGHAAYVLQGARTLGKLRTWRVHVTGDRTDILDDIAFGMITNSRSVGGFPNLTGSGVDLSDGLFEVTLIRLPSNPAELNDLVSALAGADFENTDMIYHFSTRSLRIECDEPISWTRDGEYAGDHARVDISVLEKRLKIMVPASGGTGPGNGGGKT